VGDNLIDNKKVENFFRNRKKEASILRAVLVFVVVTFFMSLLTLFSDYSQRLDLIFNPQLQSSVIGSVVYSFLALAILFFVPAIGLNWIIGKEIYKSKARLVEVAYVFMLAFSSFLIPFIVAAMLEFVYAPIAPLALIFFLFFFYIIIVATKELHNLSYWHSFVLMTLSNGVAGIVRLGMAMVYVYFLMSSPVHYENNITDNSDGTITATFAEIHTETGIPRDICYVMLPEGWKVVDNESETRIETYLDTHVPSDATFTNGNNTFLFFEYGLPRGGYKTGPHIKCDETISEYREWWFEKNFDPKYDTYQNDFISYEENLVEACDSKILNNNETITRHISSGSFIGNTLGFVIIYQSPAGEDEDLYFIINNIRCYNNY